MIQDYCGRMTEKQEGIYYATGESELELSQSPFLERLHRKGLEVLYMTDPLDEYVVQQMREYNGIELISVSKEGLKFGDESESDLEKQKQLDEEFKDLSSWLKELYGDKVSD